MQRLIEFTLFENGGKIWQTLNTQQRKNYIYNSFLKKGYTPIQSAAIVGNLQQENSSFGTTVKNRSSGAIGIAQWLGSRKKNLFENKDWHDIDRQIDFIDKEVRGDKNEWTNLAGGKNAFFKTDNLEEAVKIFRRDFERPGEKEANDGKRISNAYELVSSSKSFVKENNNSGNEDYLDYINDIKNSNINYDFSEIQKLENEKISQNIESEKMDLQNQIIQNKLNERQNQIEQIIQMTPHLQHISSNYKKNNYIDLLQSSQNDI